MLGGVACGLGFGLETHSVLLATAIGFALLLALFANHRSAKAAFRQCFSGGRRMNSRIKGFFGSCIDTFAEFAINVAAGLTPTRAYKSKPDR